MSSPLEALTLDLLEWIDARPRTYAEAMEAWRTSCPRLPVWEDALDRGLIARHGRRGRPPTVSLTASGRALLDRRRGARPQPDPKPV
jgi:hypothetical protein